MDILIKIGAGLLLLIGAIYPMLGITEMVRWANRQKAPFRNPLPAMLRLMLIATVPLAGILGGLAVFLPQIWASEVLRIVIYATGAFSVLGLVALVILSRLDTA